MSLPMQTTQTPNLSNNEGVFYGAKFTLTSVEMERKKMDHYESWKKKQDRQIEDDDLEWKKKKCDIKFFDTKRHNSEN